jgi:hypothetical protein
MTRSAARRTINSGIKPRMRRHTKRTLR